MVTQIKLVVVVVVDNAMYFLLLGSIMKKNEILLLLLGLAQGNKEFVWEAPMKDCEQWPESIFGVAFQKEVCSILKLDSLLDFKAV